MSSWVNWKSFVMISALYIDYFFLNSASAGSVGQVLKAERRDLVCKVRDPCPDESILVYPGMVLGAIGFTFLPWRELTSWLVAGDLAWCLLRNVAF